MKLNYIILSILLITGSFQEVTEDYIKDKYEDYCDGREYSDVSDFQHKLDDYREDRTNEYYNDIGIVLEDLGSGERRKIIDLTIAPYILLIIYLFFVFVMLILFFLTYLNVVKCKHIKSLIFISAIFFLIVFVCFWVGLGFMVTANKSRREAYCYLYKIQTNLLYGNVNDGAEAFIGVHNMVSLVTAFEQEIPEIQRTSQNYISLQNANFKQNAQQAFQQVITFVNNNQAQTHNASGVLKKPISNMEIQPTINAQVETEFVELYRLGAKLSEFAQIIRDFETDSYAQQMTSVVSALKTQYARFALALLDLEHSVGHYDKVERHLKYGSRITLYSTMVFVIFGLVALLMACGSESVRKNGYCMLVIASLVLLLAATGFMFWIFGVAESSAFCGALRDVNEGKLEVMTSRNVSEDFLNFVKSCIVEDKSVDYRQTILTTSSSQTYYNDFLRYVEALTEYRNFIAKNQVNSVEIPKAKEQWQKIVDGTMQDHLDAKDKLEAFNDAISCDGSTFFAFALPACDDDSDCKSIADTATYGAPSCVDNVSQVNQDFINLKQYTTDSITNAKKLISEAGETTNVNTPNGAYTQAATYMKNFQPQVQQASTIHDNSLKVIHEGRTYNDVSDCSMFKKDSLRLEYYGCYNFTYWNYKALIVWAVLVVSAFLYLLFMFWALGKDQEEQEKEKEIEYTPEPEKFYTNQADDLNVDDNEKIPMA